MYRQSSIPTAKADITGSSDIKINLESLSINIYTML